MDDLEPTVGLQGDYRDSCTACMRPTDTGLAFRGEAEFIIAGLVCMGIPLDQASVSFSLATGSDPGTVPAGILTHVIRVCDDRASRAGLRIGLLAGESAVPLYEDQP
jgi:hypothetical protein